MNMRLEQVLYYLSKHQDIVRNTIEHAKAMHRVKL